MPNITVDISADYLWWDNVHTVSLTSQDGTTTVDDLRAIKETITQAGEAQGPTTVPPLRCRWHLFVAELTAWLRYVPQRSGYVTDEDGIKHFIDDIELASWDTRYVLSTTAEVAAVLEPPGGV